MMMNVRKHLWSMARMFLPAVGFALTCIGAYMISLQAENEDSWDFVPAYVIIMFGFLAVLFGVFWIVCHSMRSKLYQRRPHQQTVHVYTIERPSFFPPSYDESQYDQTFPADAEFGSEVVAGGTGTDVETGPAPPLYSRDDDVDGPDCTWSWERPPRYSQVERTTQQQTAAVAEALSGH